MKSAAFLIWIFAFFTNLGLPKDFVKQLRHSFGYLASFSTSASHVRVESVEKDKLALENQNLNQTLSALYEWLFFESRIDERMDRLDKLMQKIEGEEEILQKEFFQRRSDELKRILDLQIHGVMGRVIYRSPISWGSSLWISVGEDDNAKLEQPIIQKHSPVMAGPYVVGIIEEVRKKRSKVRLIMDSGLVVAVRAVRGISADQEIVEAIEALQKRIVPRKDLNEVGRQTLSVLDDLKMQLDSNNDLYLAKGELYGSSSPIWGMYEPTLKGSGFHYEFADKEGESMDLRSENLIQEGDLLVTSGLDGLFPPGLSIAFVSKVKKLRHESYYYDIEAKPYHHDINNLEYLFVLPPIDNECQEFLTQAI